MDISEFEIGKSRIHGKGLFATVNIKKGRRLFFIPGTRVRYEIKGSNESNRFINWIGLGKTVWLNPNRTRARYLNHSCDPNTAIVGKRTLIAIKDIRKGDEITFDYSFTDVDPHWHIRCHCGARNCRKVVGSIHTIPPKIYKGHLPHIPKYFQKAYTNNVRANKRGS